MAKRTKNGTVYTTNLECALTREGAQVKATHRDDGQWIVRAYRGSEVDGPYAILRTRDVKEARAHWKRLVLALRDAGFTSKGEK